MTAPSFANAGLLNIQGTPTLHLATLLYTIQGQYWDPIKKSNQPLPPHYWALYQPSNVSTIFASAASDATGLCALKIPDTGLPDGEYALAMFPTVADVQKAYMAQNEAWVDLTTNLWVTPPPTTPTRVDRRKQVRIPMWTTNIKAYYGGGFSDAPPKAKDYFQTKGLLKKDEIEPYGTAATPWNIPIDYGWIKAHVRYLFVNWGVGKEETLPPGLVVVATDAAGKTLGAGTAIDDSDGTAYVLATATIDKWKTMHLGFTVPGGTRVDLSSPAGTPDQRLNCNGSTPDDRTTRNTLPQTWHSYGMGATYAATATGTPAATRKTWTDLRKDIAADASATEPLIVFQLDDVVLFDRNKLATLAAGTRLTQFDHLLKIRNPDPAMPYVSTGTFGSPLLDQKTVFPVNSPTPTAPTVPRDLGIRLVTIENRFYDLEEKRVIGTPGTTLCLGSRAAVLSDHVSANYSAGCSYVDGKGHHELHYIEVPFVKDPATGLGLSHLVVYVGSKITLNPGTAAAQNALYSNLDYASTRWSQGHPGVTQPGATSPAKDYQIVPADSSKRGTTVVRLRFFYGTRSDGQHKFEIQLTVDPTPPGRPKKRSFVQGGVMTYYDNACINDAATTSPTNKDADGSPAYWHTLSHEFGHVCGLPDEYYEQVDPKVVDTTGSLGLRLTEPFMPAFHQYSGWTTDARPYWGDKFAMMRQNMLLRLRHVWHHARAFSADPAFSKVADHPHLVRNNGYPSGGLDFATPEGNTRNPYTAVFTSPMTGGLADLLLFPVGEDEGLVEAMMSPGVPRAAGTRFDALLVVRSKFLFVFNASINQTFQWNTMMAFHQNFYDTTYRELVRFQLVGGNRFKSIAVLFHPAYAYASTPATDPTHFTLNVASMAAVPPASSPFILDNPTTFNVGVADISSPWPLVRLAMSCKAYVPAAAGATPNRVPATAVIGLADITPLAGRVDQLLGDAVGSRTAQAL
jgi:hypothetical protein